MAGLTPEFFTVKAQFYKMGRPPYRVDIITSAQGAPFGDAWKLKATRKLGGVKVYYASIKHLIAMKKSRWPTARFIGSREIKAC